MLTIAYDGTEFHGWQKQEPPDRDTPMRTVQGVVEQAVRETVGQPVILMGASRTDSGVHALGQVAAFTAETRVPVERLAEAITSRLPQDVQILDARLAANDFDPIGGATAKAYRYTIAHGVGPGRGEAHMRPLFDRNQVFWTYHPLDAARMHEGAQHLIGEHDFTSFANINHGRLTAVRTIFDCSVRAISDHRCCIEVSGSGFLYHMVRIIAGTLMEVGRGKFEPGDVAQMLAARDRTASGPTLPPTGLCLLWVRYDEA